MPVIDGQGPKLIELSLKVFGHLLFDRQQKREEMKGETEEGLHETNFPSLT